MPIGAVVAHGAAADVFKPGNHGTTFGGNPLAMRAALTTIEVMEADKLLQNAERLGNTLREDFIARTARAWMASSRCAARG